jgi:hypothetical protein
MMRLATLLCLLVPLALFGQAPKKKDLSPPGYKKDNLRGFILFISDESLENDKKSKLDRSPLEALERELILIERAVPAEKLKALKNVPIWVEWDESLAMSNGRGGSALAVFLGGHQLDLVSEAKRDVKANSVTLLKLRSLANEHQPKRESNRSVMLHEMAHAYHHFVVGKGNPYVTAAYKQAMERKLYDPTLYAATNENEYFAELTCAYLERLDYYPRNRDDLKKLDPKGFEMMERFWGKLAPSKNSTASKGPTLPSADGGGKFKLDLTRQNLTFGQKRIGDAPEVKDLKEKTLLLFYWSPLDEQQLALLTRMKALQEELGDYGFTIVSATNATTPTEAIRDAVKRRDFKIPVVSQVGFGATESFSLPHAMLYDPAGKCVFRGDPHDVEIFARLEVGKQILAQANKSEWTKTVQPLVDLLEKGSALSAVYTKAGTFYELSGDNKADYTLLTDLLAVEAKKVVSEWEGKMKEEPVAAFLQLEALATKYKGLPIAKSATNLTNKLRSNTKVLLELRARAALEPIKKLDTQLSSKKYSFDPTHPEFQLQNALLLDQLRKAIEKVRKAYPGTQAAEDANKFGDRWLVGARSTE